MCVHGWLRNENAFVSLFKPFSVRLSVRKQQLYRFLSSFLQMWCSRVWAHKYRRRKQSRRCSRSASRLKPTVHNKHLNSLQRLAQQNLTNIGPRPTLAVTLTSPPPTEDTEALVKNDNLTATDRMSSLCAVTFTVWMRPAAIRATQCHLLKHLRSVSSPLPLISVFINMKIWRFSKRRMLNILKFKLVKCKDFLLFCLLCHYTICWIFWGFGLLL